MSSKAIRAVEKDKTIEVLQIERNLRRQQTSVQYFRNGRQVVETVLSRLNKRFNRCLEENNTTNVCENAVENLQNYKQVRFLLQIFNLFSTIANRKL